jgi:hypothetical protein
MSGIVSTQIIIPGPPFLSAVRQPGMRTLAPGEECYTAPG